VTGHQDASHDLPGDLQVLIDNVAYLKMSSAKRTVFDYLERALETKGWVIDMQLSSRWRTPLLMNF
jgi:hypothetical protein